MLFVNFPIQTNPPIHSYEELKARAEQNDVNALYWEAECLWRGENVNKQTGLASKYFLLAALKGSPEGYYKLGELYRYGQSVTKNVNLACILFQAAYALGIKKALSAYALILLENIKTEDSVIQGNILLKYAKDIGDDNADYYIEEYYPEADELDVNMNITEEMLDAWIRQGIEGIFKEIERLIEHHYLLFGDLEFHGDDAVFFSKVETILNEWKKNDVIETELVSNVAEKTNNISWHINPHREENNIGYATGVTFGIANNSSILYGMKKFNQRQAHGSAAERANHLFDLLHGRKSSILGNDNAYGGPDRYVNGVYLQSKYRKRGGECIGDAFDKNGYKYMVDGKPMPIEVPADQEIYASALKSMERRITNGEVPGVSDPAEAKNLVRRGHVTYKQAMNIAKAGTIESITYDAVNGAIVATSTFGISAMVTFAIAIWSGENWKEAVKMSVESGLKVAGTAFVSSVISAQLVRVVNHSVAGTTIEKGANIIFKQLSPKTTEFYIRAHQCGVMNIYNEPMSRAAELFKNDLITGSVTIALMSIPNVIDLFRGRISTKQMAKNVIETTAAVAGGGIGRSVGSVIGARLIPIPKIGAFLGGLAGAAICSYFAQSASKYVLDMFIDDDAEEMLLIIEDVFGRMVLDYMTSEEETTEIMEELTEILDVDFLKDMYASDEREQFAEDVLSEYFENVSYNRKHIIVPESGEMLNAIDNILDSIANKYEKIA